MEERGPIEGGLVGKKNLGENVLSKPLFVKKGNQIIRGKDRWVLARKGGRKDKYNEKL